MPIATDEDLEYFIRECGDILGISSQLAEDKKGAKNIIEHVLHQIVEFKKINEVYIDLLFSEYTVIYYYVIVCS